VESKERRLAAVARAQHGAFTVDQARGCGFTAAGIRRRAARGLYERVHRGVYRAAGAEPTWRGDVVAAVLALTVTPAAASHRTAAHLWGMSSHQPSTIEVVAVRHRRIHTDGFVVHESKDLVPGDVVDLDGVPVTTAVRTIVDLGASASPRFVEHCLDTGLRLGLFSSWEVLHFIARVAKSGRNGVGTIRPLVLQRLEWKGVTESVLEDRFRSLLSTFGLELPVPQYEVRAPDGSFVCRADFAYPERKILIELDSEAHHMDAEAFHGDREKQNRAQRLGWTVYRFTWRQVVTDPTATLDLLASLTQQ